MRSVIVIVGALLVTTVVVGSPLKFEGTNPFSWTREMPKLPTGKIVGGESTTIKKVPHQVSIELWGNLHCGGSIISDTWVLTAAHCATRPSWSYKIRTGSDQSGTGGSEHGVAEIIRHENYHTTRYGVPVNDIALFRLDSSLSMNETARSIVLFDANEEAVPGSYAVITGWGRNEAGKLPGQLQTVSVPVVSKEECSDAYAYFGGIPAGQICAAYPKGGKDACQGDSGGPMTIDGRLAGVVSWGNGCGIPGYPGVYTEVAHYRQWILAHSGI